MTEETQQAEQTAQNEPQANSPDVGKLRDTKKEKCRPMTKVVIRRLPPTMTQDQFLEQVSPLPEHDYLHFVKADMSLGQFAFSRAYINFINQEDIFVFREKFDNYVFVDSKGTEHPAVVEFAPFQRLPKKRAGKKKDLKCGTIETDPYYIGFLESLKNQEADAGVAQPKTEFSYQPSDNASKKITTTPLLEYLKLRKQEKQRIRDEKREERRRRDLERRRTKDDPIISKVLKNPDLDKDINKDNKENKEEKDKTSPKDLKNRNKRDEKLREKMPRDREPKPFVKGYRERVDERNKERDLKHQRRHDDKKLYGRRDDRESVVKEERKNDTREERKYEFKEDYKEMKERKVEEKRGKSYEKMRQEKKRLAETKRLSNEVNVESSEVTKTKQEEQSSLPKDDTQAEVCSTVFEKEQTRFNEDSVKRESEDDKTIGSKSDGRVADTKDTSMAVGKGTQPEKSKSNEHLNEANESTDKKESKLVKRRSSLESGGEGCTGDGSCLRRHKSLDGGDQCNLQKSEGEEKEKGKKDPRLERRIRNKDRPAMEIYRPGMGKFSKQRLEREKSSNDERASLSQSPTPTSTTSTTSKPGKPGTEVRSMMFKRSVSRDVA